MDNYRTSIGDIELLEYARGHMLATLVNMGDDVSNSWKKLYVLNKHVLMVLLDAILCSRSCLPMALTTHGTNIETICANFAK